MLCWTPKIIKISLCEALVCPIGLGRPVHEQLRDISGVARGGGLGGSNPLHCERSCIFYCLVIEQKQCICSISFDVA